MPKGDLPTPGARVANVLLLALLGGVLGALFGAALPGGAGPPRELPLPYVRPAIPGGTSLRLAMIHDVLLERYPRHGAAYYEARNAASLATIEASRGGRASFEALDAYDDLGAGLDHLGQSPRAVELLREKAARLAEAFPDPPAELDLGGLADPFGRYEVLQAGLEQTARDPVRRAYYRTWANLGTFLIHASFRGAIGGDAGAIDGLREGLALVERALAVNPGAHFGREAWQVVAANFILAALARPELLTRYDLIGDALAEPVDPLAGQLTEGMTHAYYTQDQFEQRPVAVVREGITEVGGEGSWDADVPAVAAAVPAAFDQPVLGILGMWMLGGGPNPHFALALGSIMERVGQRYLAFTAYSRALSMGDRFWPDPAVREALVAHCRARRDALARSLPETVDALQAEFEAGLAAGLDYQRAYQQFEAERLASGEDLSAPEAYAAFHAAHPAIATPSGKSDVFYREAGSRSPGGGNPLALGGYALLAAGLFGWLGLLVRSSRARPR